MDKTEINRIVIRLTNFFIDISGYPSTIPAVSPSELKECYAAFLKTRGRYEWEHEAVLKVLIDCSCPIFFVESYWPESLGPKPNEKRIVCDKCKDYYDKQ